MRIYLLVVLLSCSAKGYTQTTIPPQIYRQADVEVCRVYNNVNSKASTTIDSTTLLVQQSGESYIETPVDKRLFLISNSGIQFTLIGDPGAINVNISNYSEDSIAYITLLKGSATVACNGTTWKVQEEQAIQVGDSVGIRDPEIAIEYDTAWLRGRYGVDEKPLFVILNALARMAGYTVKYFGEKPVDLYTITPGLRRLFEGRLHDLYGINWIGPYSIKGKTVTIFKAYAIE